MVNHWSQYTSVDDKIEKDESHHNYKHISQSSGKNYLYIERNGKKKKKKKKTRQSH